MGSDGGVDTARDGFEHQLAPLAPEHSDGLPYHRAARYASLCPLLLECVDLRRDLAELFERCLGIGQANLLAVERAIQQLGAEREKRWGRVRLLGERRYGELLGPATPGRDGGESDKQSDSTYKQRERARQVASVPDDVFTEYVQEEEKPTPKLCLPRAAKR